MPESKTSVMSPNKIKPNRPKINPVLSDSFLVKLFTGREDLIPPSQYDIDHPMVAAFKQDEFGNPSAGPIWLDKNPWYKKENRRNKDIILSSYSNARK